MTMDVTAMQSLIDEEYGTFDDDVHETVLVDESAVTDAIILLPSARVYNFETGGGLMFDWVMEPDLEEED